MNRTIQSFLLGTFMAMFFFAFIYFLGAFYMATFNIKYWDENVLNHVTFIGGGFALFSGIITFALVYNKNLWE